MSSNVKGNFRIFAPSHTGVTAGLSTFMWEELEHKLHVAVLTVFSRIDYDEL